MSIFEEPSRQPLPQPTLDDIKHAVGKALISRLPGIGGPGSEWIGLLSSPVANRRDAWLEDLERRLRELETKVAGFRFEDLRQNERFVSAVLHSTQVAMRTHQAEKREALRNAVLNIAVANPNLPADAFQMIFLNLIDRFTPAHLQILSHIRDRASTPKPEIERDLCNLIVQDLLDHSLLKDKRPYVARNRDYADLLSV